MAVIGTSQTQRELLESAAKIFEDVIELEKGSNVLRVIQGPQKTNTLFYPTIVEVTDNGEKTIKATFKALNFLDVPPIVNSIVTAEQTARKSIGNTEELGMRVQTRWWYLAINTLDTANIKLKPARFPKTVKDDITKIETRLDVKDNTYLLDGHFFLYDILIEKIIDPTKPKRYGTTYKTSVYGNNQWKQRIPASWLKANPNEVIEGLGGMEAVFPVEYIDTIQSCDINLEKLLVPMTEAQVMDALQKFPINLLGRKSTEGGGLAFPQNPEFEEILKSMNLPVVHFDTETKKQIVQGTGGVKLKKVAEEVKPVEEVKQTEEAKPAASSTIKPLVTEEPKVEEKPVDTIKPAKLTLSGLKK